MAHFPLAVITDEFSQDFEEVCRTVAPLGVSALEVRTAWDKNIVDLSDEEIEDLGRVAAGAGLKIISVASPVYKCTLPDGGDVDHRFEQDAFHSAHTYEDQPAILDRSLRIAKKLGAPIVRVFSFWRTVEPQRNRERIIELLRKAVEAAAPLGLRIGIENEHACHFATAAETAPVLDAIPSETLGLVWDPANAYFAGEKPFPDGYRLLNPARIIHVHAKDGVMPPGSDRMTWKEVGAGEVDWKGLLSALARDGYRGAVSLETHWGGPDGNKFEGSKICARNLARLVAEAS